MSYPQYSNSQSRGTSFSDAFPIVLLFAVLVSSLYSASLAPQANVQIFQWAVDAKTLQWWHGMLMLYPLIVLVVHDRHRYPVIAGVLSICCIGVSFACFVAAGAIVSGVLWVVAIAAATTIVVFVVSIVLFSGINGKFRWH